MPSDAKKAKAAAKKNVRKAKDIKGPKKTEEDANNGSISGDENGSGVQTPLSNGTSDAPSGAQSASLSKVSSVAKAMDQLDDKLHALHLVEAINAENRSCTGVLASHPNCRDVHIHQFSITFYGQELVVDSKLELNHGRRYGLLGVNGSGKSQVLFAISNRDIPIPSHLDIFHLAREIAPTEKTALQSVIDCDTEVKMLEDEADRLCEADPDDVDSQDRLQEIYEQLDELNSDTREARAANILYGLGFTSFMQNKQCKDFSGGWRMRIALARALYLSPSLLLLDEPSNHLDLDACVWLENELKNYKRSLIIISHSQDFLNNVCTNIINLTRKKLEYYTGNFDMFIKTREELETNQMKRYNKEQEEIAHMKNYIARFGHGSAKLARQAQSKEKTLKKMVDNGLTEKVVAEKSISFRFYDCGDIPPPVIMIQNISFQYKPGTEYIYKNLDFGIDLDTRIALVGPNGAGKSTLLKLIDGQLNPTEGVIRRNSHLKFGRYHQHLAETLDLNISALDYMMQQFPEVKEIEDMRRIIGRYGLTGKNQTCPMKNLSDGQRCRVCFAWMAHQRPHLLLLDEPTNHLDIETIDSLANALNAFEGGMVLVSHDFRLINQVAKEIYICENQTITKWTGDIISYKDHLAKRIAKKLANLKK